VFATPSSTVPFVERIIQCVIQVSNARGRGRPERANKTNLMPALLADRPSSNQSNLPRSGRVSRIQALALLAAVVAAQLLAKPGAAAGADQPPITVFAAASLRESFEAAAPAFTRKTGISVSFNFAGSDTLETQIAEGAPADVFASANKTQMQKAADGGLLAGEPRVFARNGLVIVIPKNNPGRVSRAADLGHSGVHLVLAAPTVPVGSYARATFANLAKFPGYGAAFVQGVNANIVSNEVDVKAVVTKVSLGEADAGVCYLTDVTPSVAKTVSTIAFPAGAAPEATYPIAVVKAARSAAGAQAFIDFVLSPDGQAFLKDRGFIVPQPAGVR
jgi:molybdate transport system substrate-binding protein